MNVEINNGLLISPYEEKRYDYGYAFLSTPTHSQNENANTLKYWFLKKTQ